MQGISSKTDQRAAVKKVSLPNNTIRDIIYYVPFETLLNVVMIDNGRSHDFGGLGFTSSKSRDHNWVQVSRNDEESCNAGESKSSNIDVMMASAVATGSTISGSAASIKFMASHVRAPGSKNYIQRSAKDLKLQAKESFQSDESAKQTYSTATRPILTITSKIVNSNPITFKPQKDKRQKLDGIDRKSVV